VVLFFRHKKQKQAPDIMPKVADIKNDPTTIEVEKIKRGAHQDLDHANEVVDRFKARVQIENHFTMQIIHILGGKR
jgi:hypothetical protein